MSKNRLVIKFQSILVGIYIQNYEKSAITRTSQAIISQKHPKIRKITAESCRYEIKILILHHKTKTVTWMSGLVPGLQNQLERFDSASDLQQMQLISQKISCFFYSSPTPKTKTNYQRQRYRLNFFNSLTS